LKGFQKKKEKMALTWMKESVLTLVREKIPGKTRTFLRFNSFRQVKPDGFNCDYKIQITNQ
jgi:hypothetical protein